MTAAVMPDATQKAPQLSHPRAPRFFALLVVPLGLLCLSLTVVRIPSRLVLRPARNPRDAPPPTATVRLPLPPTDFPQRCHVVGHDPASGQVWGPNTRAFCLTAGVCIRPASQTFNAELYVAAAAADTTCVADRPSMRPLPARESPALDCARLVAHHVECAHGKYRKFSQPLCPVRRGMHELAPAERAALQWRDDDELAVIVPAMPYLRNIYHFAFVVASLDDLLRNMATLQHDWLRPVLSAGQRAMRPSLANTTVHIVFRHVEPKRLGVLHGAIFDAVLRRHAPSFADIRVSALGEEKEGGDFSARNNNSATCFRRAVMLGARRIINVWPFANGSAVSTSGDRVPASAVLFRRAVYDGLGIASALPRDLPAVDGARLRFPVPPARLVYARRDTLPDPAPGATLPRGKTRRLGEADERWFRAMLRAECARAGLSYGEFVANRSESARTQVARFAGAGAVVGIHGANLANAVFAAPFGGLFELFPGGTGPYGTGGKALPCYIAGANSGLSYAHHVAQWASVRESGCRADDVLCVEYVRGRLVKLRTPWHREQVRDKVRLLVARVARLRARFPRGVPVRYDATVGEFVVDGEA